MTSPQLRVRESYYPGIAEPVVEADAPFRGLRDRREQMDFPAREWLLGQAGPDSQSLRQRTDLDPVYVGHVLGLRPRG